MKNNSHAYYTTTNMHTKEKHTFIQNKTNLPTQQNNANTYEYNM